MGDTGRGAPRCMVDRFNEWAINWMGSDDHHDGLGDRGGDDRGARAGSFGHRGARGRARDASDVSDASCGRGAARGARMHLPWCYIMSPRFRFLRSCTKSCDYLPVR